MMLSWAHLLIAAFITAAFAQPTLTETYTRPDEFEIAYPAGWQVTPDEATGFVSLSQGELQLTLYSPTTLAAYALDNYNPATLTSLILALNTVTADELQFVDVGGRETAIHPYTNTTTSHAGLLVARPFKDGAIGLIDAYGLPAVLDENADLILQIAATFDLPPVPAPLTLVNHAAPWSQAVAELESSGLIPTGGDLVFVEGYVFAAGKNRTQPLVQALTLRDVVVAGSLTYTPSTNPVNESCGIIAHRIDDSTKLEIGIDSDGNLYAAENADSSVALQTDLDPTAPHRVLFAALDDRLLVYLNGQLIADREVATQAGHFGLRVQGDGPGATCEVTDLWVYRVPDVTPGTCDITASSGAVNKRSGPGTNFEIAGVMDDGETQPAIALSTGGDNLTWWQLRDGSWVREDVVSEAGACRGLPASG